MWVVSLIVEDNHQVNVKGAEKLSRKPISHNYKKAIKEIRLPAFPLLTKNIAQKVTIRIGDNKHTTQPFLSISTAFWQATAATSDNSS